MANGLHRGNGRHLDALIGAVQIAVGDAEPGRRRDPQGGEVVADVTRPGNLGDRRAVKMPRGGLAQRGDDRGVLGEAERRPARRAADSGGRDARRALVDERVVRTRLSNLCSIQ